MILKKNYKMKSLEHRKQYKMHKNGKNPFKILKNFIRLCMSIDEINITSEQSNEVQRRFR